MFTKVPELRKTVLVVVREPELRTRFSRFIEQTGFAVVEVDCHEKAWTILEMRSDVQVVFADLDAENGSEKFELARKVYQRWPSMGVLLTSGRIRFVSPSAVPGNGCFLPRPLPADILVSEMTLAADQGQCRSRYQPTTRSDGASN